MICLINDLERHLEECDGDQKIVTTLCPAGKERMRRLIIVIQSNRVNLTPLVTHRFTLVQLDMSKGRRD